MKRMTEKIINVKELLCRYFGELLLNPNISDKSEAHRYELSIWGNFFPELSVDS